MSAAVLAAATVLAAWTYLVVSYDSPLGTDNTILIETNSDTTNTTNDLLATLSFKQGGENLDWASMQIELVVDENSYTCSFGSQSVVLERGIEGIFTLASDGLSFSTTLDATSESEFTYLSLPSQQEGNQSEFTIRASKTDIFLSDGVEWTFLPEKTIQEVHSANQTDFSNETSERLEWHTHDIATASNHTE